MECDIAGIDGVILAVVYRGLDIHNRTPRENARFEGLLDALVYRRDEVCRDNAALDLVDELVSLASLPGGNAKVDMRKLARPARLFLVPVVRLGVRGDGFFVCDLRR